MQVHCENIRLPGVISYHFVNNIEYSYKINLIYVFDFDSLGVRQHFLCDSKF
jgi:hypothetical protein